MPRSSFASPPTSLAIPSRLRELRREFAASGFVLLPGFLPESTRALLDGAYDELQSMALRKDFVMPETDSSPRHLFVINGHATLAHPQIRELYASRTLRGFIANVTGLAVRDCPVAHEAVIYTSLREAGDTHGWHLDDFPVTLIMSLRMPGPGAGGEVEFTDLAGRAREARLRPRDAYLMRSDLVHHRVRPLACRGERRILNFTYAEKGAEYTPNGTAERLCT